MRYIFNWWKSMKWEYTHLIPKFHINTWHYEYDNSCGFDIFTKLTTYFWCWQGNESYLNTPMILWLINRFQGSFVWRVSKETYFSSHKLFLWRAFKKNEIVNEGYCIIHRNHVCYYLTTYIKFCYNVNTLFYTKLQKIHYMRLRYQPC